MHSASQNPKLLKSGFILKCCFAIEVALLNTVATVWLPLSLHNLVLFCQLLCSNFRQVSQYYRYNHFFFTATAVLQLKTVREFTVNLHPTRVGIKILAHGLWKIYYLNVFPRAFSDESMSLKVMHVDTDEVLKGQGKKNTLNSTNALF